MPTKRLIGCLVSICSVQVWAWGDLGHETVGHIAEQYLSKRAKMLITKVNGPEHLALAGIWPDQVKSDLKRYSDRSLKLGVNFSPYHYLSIEPGYQNDYRKLPAKMIPERDAVTIIKQAPGHMLKPNSVWSLEQKRIMIRYLVHIVGDIHQPLHVGNNWDRGGNDCYVKYPEKSGKLKRKRLHSIWDTALVEDFRGDFYRQGGKGWFGYVQLATMVIKQQKSSGLEKEFDKDIKNQGNYYAWFSESRKLHPKVYPDKTPVSHPKKRLYCKIKRDNFRVDDPDASKYPVIDKAYIGKAKVLISQRLYLAGRRLALMINDIARQADKSMLAKQKVIETIKPIWGILKNK